MERRGFRQRVSIMIGEDKKIKASKGSSGEKLAGPSKSSRPPDILDEAAMENAYNICHNVQDLLFYRGFRWEGAKQKGKGKGRKKGRKSKG